MPLAYDVIAFYGALLIWIGLLVFGWRRQNYRAFFWFGIGLLLALNLRYFIEGAPASIAFFIGIYDVLDNLGVTAGNLPAALAPCPDNACTVWGDRYQTHPSWGVAFYDRFANGPDSRTWLLLGHLGFNSVVFILMHWQLARPGFGKNKSLHRTIGKLSFGLLTAGTLCAILLANQHDAVGSYGGAWSKYGFWFMSLCVYSCAVMGVVKARNADIDAHRIWMIRFIGSMWGAFWLFRVMLFVLGPLLREYDAAAIQICIWFSAPLGILIAETIRRRIGQKNRSSAATTATA